MALRSQVVALAAGLAASLLAGLAAPPARATFPGVNGTIAMTISGSVVGLWPDGREVQVFRASEDVRGFSWSADGRRLAGSQPGYILVGAFGAQPRRIVREVGSFIPGRVSWSPDSRQLVYARPVGESGGGVLAVVGSAGGTPASITSDEGGGTTVDSDPDWSPTGDRIAFARTRYEGPGSGLALVPPGGGAAILLVSAASLGIEEPVSFAPIEFPSWSPDGRNLAFMARIGEGIGVYVVSASGGTPRRIASGAYPAWSPDGTLIAFRAGQGISVVRPDGSGLRVIKAEYEGARLSWQARPNVRAPNVVSVRAPKPAYFPPSEARIRRERARGRFLEGIHTDALANPAVVRFDRRVEEVDLELSLARLLPGVRRGRRCVATRGSVARSRRCTVARRVAPPTVSSGPRVVNARTFSLAWDGTWGTWGGHGRRLATGRYRLTVRALGTGGAGRAASAIVRVGGSCLAARKCQFRRGSG